MFNPELIEYTNIKESKEKIIENAMGSYITRHEENGVEIGEGRTAKVLILEEDKSICMKAVFNKEISLNDSNKEMKFLDELSKKGYPVPKPVCSIKTDENDYLFIETIATEKNLNGMSLTDLIEKDLIDDLPDNFNFKIFFNRLNEIIDNLNNNEKIYHRDLHPGNIMINTEGLPSIIDFGDAEKIHGGEDPFRRIDAKGEMKIAHKDSDKAIEAYRMVGQYLKLKNWFNK